ncbi:hypothetical protein GYMLUDRAFT_51032 [Collybiopsis luxurians FD-317 M1]|uniref:Uncharacterized protein n=1 Tax=Collybiopsis luxurians FD-317 M1 TaxID=944289 RepID=A0A0D0BZ55_9AGAR|nr:hypothetical protein GYMLUDRAFT_51032 [Collybiopsis luxurians FD-317 M1]
MTWATTLSNSSVKCLAIAQLIILRRIRARVIQLGTLDNHHDLIWIDGYGG